MSIINKTPFIKSLIASLSDSDLTTLKAMVDGGGSQTVLMKTTSTLSVNGTRTRLSTSDKGVHRCSLEVNNGLYTWNGYLVYNNTHCVLIYYSDDFQKLGWLQIDTNNFIDFEYINEELSILELRNELEDTSSSEKAETIEAVNEGLDDGSVNAPTLKNITNITALSDELLSSLKCGDVLTKEDSSGKHSYTVTYKKDNVGICLSYFAAGYTETVSYDYTGGHWVYNSTDIIPIPEVAANPTLAGTESELAGLEVDGTKYKVVTSSDVSGAINTAIYGAIDDNY